MSKIAYGAYMTPFWPIRLFLQYGAPDLHGPIIDPCAGRGHMLQVASELGRGPVYGDDIQDEFRRHLVDRNIAWEPERGDVGIDRIATPLIVRNQWGRPAGAVLSNPDFAFAFEFVQAYAGKYPRTIVLLRSAFDASEGRHDWLTEHPPIRQWVMPRRIAFVATCGARLDNGKKCTGKVPINPKTLEPESQLCPVCGTEGLIKTTTDNYEYSFFEWVPGYVGPTAKRRLPYCDLEYARTGGLGGTVRGGTIGHTSPVQVAA